MNILLTGDKGQLGRILRPALSTLGTMVAVNRMDTDLSDLDSLNSLLERVRPDLIVNSAAFTDVDGAESDPNKAMAINGIAPGFMARWAADNAATIIHYSTDYVFDGTGDRPWREDDAPNPINVYGESKRIGDAEILASGAPCLILRTSWVYAAHGQNFMQTMLRLGTERSELRVVADQVGAPTPAALLAKTTMAIIDQTNEDLRALLSKKGGIVNLTPTGETSWHGFAEAIFQSVKNREMPLQVARVEPIPSSEYPLPATRPLNSRLAPGALQARFKLTMPDWRDAMESVLDEIEKTHAT